MIAITDNRTIKEDEANAGRHDILQCDTMQNDSVPTLS